MTDPRTAAARLTAQLRATFAEELRSVVVFGSLPRGEAIAGVSDLNILVLLDSMSTATLGRAAPVLQGWIRQGNTPPHVYGRDEWAGMQDTFAIEITDMNDARDVLWGDDPVGIEGITAAGLRLQTERELRTTLLQLRLRLMVNAPGPDDIGALLLSGFSSFAAFMRATLRLAGEQPGLESRPVIERAAALIGADPSPMLACFDARRTGRYPSPALTDPLVEGYLAFAGALLAHIDEPDGGAGSGGAGGAGIANQPAFTSTGGPRAGVQQ